jgi:lysyl oxidase
MKVRAHSWLAVGASVVLIACLSKLEGVPALESSSSGNGDAGVERVICGGRGEACCSAPDEPCQAGLECDGGASLCVRPATRLCTTDEECQQGQVCCLAGLLGTCASGTLDECPELDLTITTPVLDTIPLTTRYDLDPVADQCATDRRCLGGPGLRTVLSFSAQLQNIGAADLLLGDPARTAGFTSAQCDGLPYVEDFIQYQLVDSNGDVRAESHVPAICPPSPKPPFSAPFDCEFLGLWSGFSQLYAPLTEVTDAGDEFTTIYLETPCQWLDITDLPPGAYALRTTVDPRGVLGEQNRANNTPPDLAIEIPQFGDPSTPCGDPPNPLFGSGVNKECGWTRNLSGTGACTPGEWVSFSCEGCGAYRICDQDGLCPYASLSSYGEDCFVGTPTDYFCSESGSYSFWQQDDGIQPTLRCEVREPSSLDAGLSVVP